MVVYLAISQVLLLYVSEVFMMTWVLIVIGDMCFNYSVYFRKVYKLETVTKLIEIYELKIKTLNFILKSWSMLSLHENSMTTFR